MDCGEDLGSDCVLLRGPGVLYLSGLFEDGAFC